jgi:DNA-binding XRE family transcriptional regulator
MAVTQTRRKRRLGEYMRDLRERAGQKPDDAARLLGIHRTTITRMETGHSICRLAELHALVGFYGASDQERAEALVRWEDAKQDSTRVVVPGVTTSQLRSYLRAEADASAERFISPSAVHGLLQTASYARAILSTPSGYRPSDQEIERSVEARTSRQALLRGPRPLTVHAILDEAAVRRIIGGPAIMREQLAHLLALSRQSNFTIQAVPFSAGSYGTMSGDFSILEFPDPDDPPAGYVEYVGGGKWVEDREDVGKLVATFETVAGTALTPANTVRLLRQQMEALQQP